MAYTTIDDPSAHFHTQLYSGTGSAQSITNDANAGDFQPDWVWVKKRTGGTARNHTLTDSTRGATKGLFSSLNDAEATNAQGLTSFNSDGFSVGTYNNFNESDGTYVAWQWKANGGSRTTFTESGDNPGGGYQTNTTAGFSIVDYVGTGADGSVSHGLGAIPHFLIIKSRDSAHGWAVYHQSTLATHNTYLETNGAKTNNTFFQNTTPTSSVFYVKTQNEINVNARNYIAYVFTEIQGYSKFGSYTGNGNADGPFVYTGFRPSWVMAKRTDSTGNWMMFDSKRDTFNVMDSYVVAHDAQAEADYPFIDFLSNGFKWRHTSGHANADGGTYIYMAFAEHPFVSSKGVPVTAR